jgi:hypothetical protein
MAVAVLEPSVRDNDDAGFVDTDANGSNNGLRRAFHTHAVGRKQPGRLDSLNVHAREACVAVEPLWMPRWVLGS